MVSSRKIERSITKERKQLEIQHEQIIISFFKKKKYQEVT